MTSQAPPFEAELQQSRRLALLADIARIVATTLDADALLQSVAECIRRHFPYPVVGLFTPDATGQTLILRAYSGVPLGPSQPTGPGIHRQPIERGIVGYVARTGRPHLAPDAAADPYHHPLDQVTIRSEVCVPIFEAGRLVGVIDVESDRLADFDAEDQSLLEAVADTVSIGLRNARLYAESQRRLQELTLLNRLSVGLGEALTLDALINGALEELHNLIKTDRTFFVNLAPDASTWETTHEQVSPSIEPIVGLSGTHDDALVELDTLLGGKPFAVFDVATDPQVEATREMYQAQGTQSILLVPVHVGEQIYGALGFSYCRQKHVWRPDEVRLLEGVAHQLGLALNNVYLIEELRQRADESAAALTRLEELERLKDEFIQNVSHELRSPLAIIRGYVEMLEAGELGELRHEQRKPVAVIARRVRMLSNLVKDITLILEAEVSPPKPEAIRLNRLARTVVEDYQFAAQQSGLTLQTEIAPDVPPVTSSHSYLRRVLDNLLSNAIKFTPAGGTVTVRVRQEGEQAVLEVSDTGIGIPPDQTERIFERFYQVNGSIWREYGGVGLGLALVKEIVETHGGRVTVTSKVGQGSTFTVLLPIATNANVKAE